MADTKQIVPPTKEPPKQTVRVTIEQGGQTVALEFKMVTVTVPMVVQSAMMANPPPKVTIEVLERTGADPDLA